MAAFEKVLNSLSLINNGTKVKLKFFKYPYFGKPFCVSGNFQKPTSNRMSKENNLKRFIEAQENTYATALAEIKNGRKQSHWMWFIFPQLQGLGFSETSKYYAIADRAEAQAFLNHPLLGSRLVAICKALLLLESTNATKILGSPDDVKLKSSMTLFASLQHTNPVFEAVLDKFFNGTKDAKTMQLLPA